MTNALIVGSLILWSALGMIFVGMILDDVGIARGKQLVNMNYKQWFVLILFGGPIAWLFILIIMFVYTACNLIEYLGD